MANEKGIQFQDFLMYSAEPVESIEDAVRAYTAYADVHRTSFDDLANEDFTDFTKWSVVSGSWLASGGMASASATGTDWNIARFNSNLSALLRDGEVHITKYDDVGGIVFRLTDADNFYMAWWDASHVGISQFVDGVQSDLNVLPVAWNGRADLELSFHENRYTTQDDNYWFFASLYIDGSLAISMGQEIDSANAPGTIFGLATKGGEGLITFSDLAVPELGRPVDWTSLESGQSAFDALNPILEWTNHRIVVGCDGTLRVWVPKAKAADDTIEESDTIRCASETDRRQIITHYRMIGVVDTVDIFDEDLIASYGHLFQQGTNPNMINPFQCYQEGRRIINQAQEEANKATIECPAPVWLQKEDVVDTLLGTYIIDNMSWDLSIGNQDARLRANITLRKYVYGA